MAVAYISMGSNINRTHHIQSGILGLKSHFSNILLSPVYESVSVGFEGDNFYNLVVSFESNNTIDETGQILNRIEDQNKRDRTGPKFGPRTLDLDLLLYDDLVLDSGSLTIPRPEIYYNAFVLKPLVDLAPDLIDPLSGEYFTKLWGDFDKSKQSLWEIDFPIT